MNTTLPIAFQGEFGAYSDLAARNIFPNKQTLPCPVFEDVFAAVREGKSDYGVIPIDNLIAGRVADIHHLIPNASVHIIGEHFEPIEHRLWGAPGATLEGVREVRSHVHALAQCKQYIANRGLTAHVVSDTAGAARELSQTKDLSVGAIASPLAGELYGLVELARNIADLQDNVTRFLVISRDALVPAAGAGPVITSIFFELRSVPAALYKAIGGFATNSINLAKLESYVGGGFQTAEFYIEAEAHPEETRMKLALEELRFFSEEVMLLGTYPAHAYRQKNLSATAA